MYLVNKQYEEHSNPLGGYFGEYIQILTIDYVPSIFLSNIEDSKDGAKSLGPVRTTAAKEAFQTLIQRFFSYY